MRGISLMRQSNVAIEPMEFGAGRLRGGVLVFLLACSLSGHKVAEFAMAHGIRYPVVMGDSKATAQLGAIEVLPVSYLYNPKGELVSDQAGEVTRASIEAYIKKKRIN